jgi:hypothetical protein
MSPKIYPTHHRKQYRIHLNETKSAHFVQLKTCTQWHLLFVISREMNFVFVGESWSHFWQCNSLRKWPLPAQRLPSLMPPMDFKLWPFIRSLWLSWLCYVGWCFFFISSWPSLWTYLLKMVFESLSLVDKIYVYIDKPETCLGKTSAKTNKYTGWVDEKKFCLFFHIINFEPSCQEETAKNIIRNSINFQRRRRSALVDVIRELDNLCCALWIADLMRVKRKKS